MAVEDSVKINLNQNLWCLVVALAALGSAERWGLRHLFWPAYLHNVGHRCIGVHFLRVLHVALLQKEKPKHGQLETPKRNGAGDLTDAFSAKSR
jgi:hypothetical protein